MDCLSTGDSASLIRFEALAEVQRNRLVKPRNEKVACLPRVNSEVNPRLNGDKSTSLWDDLLPRRKGLYG